MGTYDPIFMVFWNFSLKKKYISVAINVNQKNIKDARIDNFELSSHTFLVKIFDFIVAIVAVDKKYKNYSFCPEIFFQSIYFSHKLYTVCVQKIVALIFKFTVEKYFGHIFLLVPRRLIVNFVSQLWVPLNDIAIGSNLHDTFCDSKRKFVYVFLGIYFFGIFFYETSRGESLYFTR